MDDSLGVGTLGKTGRGTCEHWGIPTSAIDVLTSSMSHALGSVGGFCAGARTVVFHQVGECVGHFSIFLPVLFF